MKSALFGALFLAVAVGLAKQAQAQQSPFCALSLVLAVDVSSSVDEEEYRLQMAGLARALVDPEVLQAIADVGGIQITAFEWSGRYSHTDIAPWSFIAFPDDVIGFAERVRNHPRGRDDMPTALGHALGYAAGRLRAAPLQCTRSVIDVSGDGVNNDGFEPFQAYAAFPFEGVQVNGLVIAGAEPDPVAYYRSEVRRGLGSFVEVALDFADYEEAMKRKLVREIRGAALSSLRQQE